MAVPTPLQLELSNELAELRNLGIEEEKLAGFQVLFLPENIFTKRKREKLHEGGDALQFAKALKAVGVNCATLYDFGIPVPVLQRLSRDRWLGTVWIRDKIAISFVIGVLSSLVADSLHDRNAEKLSPNVHVELYLEHGNNITRLKYNGDGKTLVQMLNAIKDQ